MDHCPATTVPSNNSALRQPAVAVSNAVAIASAFVSVMDISPPWVCKHVCADTSVIVRKTADRVIGPTLSATCWKRTCKRVCEPTAGLRPPRSWFGLRMLLRMYVSLTLPLEMRRVRLGLREEVRSG
jgi:hypothetical protein